MRSITERLLGSSKHVNVLDYMLALSCEVTVKDIMEGTGLGRISVYNAVKDLCILQVLELTRKLGNVNLYRLNICSDITTQLRGLNKSLIAYQEIEVAENDAAEVMKRGG